jgi:hypothetical protein
VAEKQLKKMNIRLFTHTINSLLEFRDVARSPGGEVYGARLCVQAGNFSGSLKVAYEAECFETFIRELEHMDRTLTGTATLKALYENDFVTLELDSTGHIDVRGELPDYSEGRFLQLVFEFETDQTSLAPFIRELKMWRDMPAGGQ